jgi:hypothetical protein
MKVSEPVATYNTPNLQGLKNRLISSIDAIDDEGKLQECLEVLCRDSMPCVFTEEELDEEIRLSEASGIATDEEVAAMYAKWGLYK